MRLLLLDLLACPECSAHPLELTEIATADREVRSSRVCSAVCAERGPLGPATQSCGRCLSRDVETGFLRCPACDRFYFIEYGIPALLGDGFRDLIDTSFPSRHPEAFRGSEESLDRYLDRLRGSSSSETHDWNMDDVKFWEDNVYGDAAARAGMFDRIAVSRPDAGNRTYPRERTMFSRIRPELKGGVLLDIGCGISQTVRTVADPAEHGYVYVGVELSRSAMRVNRETLDGDFVLCSADALPFRRASVDAAIMLGTLHHLAEHQATLDRMIDTVRPGGFVALDEVIARRGVAQRLRGILRSQPPEESAHNEWVDPELIVKRLRAGGDVLEDRREFSPVRGLASRWLSEPMRTRPWLTKLVLAVDEVILRTLGRVVPVLGPHQITVIARRR